jgi:galactokinase
MFTGTLSGTMSELYDKVVRLFSEHYGEDPEAVFYAPGRVNLIGEHTDYNEGFVLPCAIDRHTCLAVKTRTDDWFRVVAANLDDRTSEWRSSLPIPPDRENSWSNYLRGVNEQFLKRGQTPVGMDITVLGNIPQGAGLSSSAAFSVAFATAINHTGRLGLSAEEIALLCQAAENEFVGCKCGIMDQLISAAGKRQHALLIDCRSLDYKSINLPADAAIVIIDSKVSRGLVDSEYNTRRSQCEEAAAALGVGSLREASMDGLLAGETLMGTKPFRRARHVISENERTTSAAEALSAGDYTALSGLMSASHASMRDDFEITTPEIDFLVETVSRILGDRGGVRMTGGGFGGCVVALAPKMYSEKIIDAVTAHYSRKTGLIAETHLCTAGDGAGQIKDHRP